MIRPESKKVGKVLVRTYNALPRKSRDVAQAYGLVKVDRH